MPLRVAIVASHPIQHFCPLYRLLAREPDIRLKVFFGSDAGLRPYTDQGFGTVVQWQPGLVDGFEHEFVEGAGGTDVSGPVPASDLCARLGRFRPDAVQIYGFYHGLSRAAYFWALPRRKRILFASDSELRQNWSQAALWKKRLILPPLFAGVDAFLSIGDCNEAFYAAYGVAKQKMYRCPYPLDADALAGALGQRESHRAEIRRRLEIPADGLIVLVVGKLIERKRQADAIHAVAALRREGHDEVYLVLAGDGPDAASLKAMAADLGGGVRFAGFVPVTELPGYYAAADILAHPASIDPHPLAAGEAISCGLPVVASDRVGCVGPTDDLRIGANAFEFPCGDVTALESHLQLLVTDSGLRARMSAESLRIARERDLEASKRGFLAAFGYGLATGRARARAAAG